MLKWLVRLGFRLTGWTLVGAPPPGHSRYVMISAPHTSNWDFLLLLGYCYVHDVPLRWMAKDSIFRFPFGPIFKLMGGVPIDRSSRHNVVATMVEAFQKHERIVVSVPPEGTRKKVPYWKTGFYYLATGAGVPLVMSFIDGPNHRVGMGPLLEPSGDIHKDMEKIAAFYGDIVGINPELTSPPALKPAQEA